MSAFQFFDHERYSVSVSFKRDENERNTKVFIVVVVAVADKINTNDVCCARASYHFTSHYMCK